MPPGGHIPMPKEIDLPSTDEIT
jgi:lipase chaperone LimK